LSDDRKTLRVDHGILHMMNELIDAGIFRNHSELFRAGVRELYSKYRDFVQKFKEEQLIR